MFDVIWRTDYDRVFKFLLFTNNYQNVFFSRPDPVRLLLTFKASLSKTDKFHGNTALHWASLSGNHVAARLLLEAGANTEIKNDKVIKLCTTVLLFFLVFGAVGQCVSFIVFFLFVCFCFFSRQNRSFHDTSFLFPQGQTPLEVALVKRGSWIAKKIREARQERGLENQGNFLNKLSGDKVYLFWNKTKNRYTDTHIYLQLNLRMILKTLKSFNLIRF